MKVWIDRILLGVVAALTAVLLISTVPWISGGHLDGTWLLLHMAASGGLVFSLPLLALSGLWRNAVGQGSGRLEAAGYWFLMLTGLLTIGTVFLCMLPIPSTDQMHELMRVHAYAGLAMVPAVAVFAIGSAKARRRQSARSATLG